MAGKVWVRGDPKHCDSRAPLFNYSTCVSLEGRVNREKVRKMLLTAFTVTVVGVLVVKTKPSFFTPFTKAASSVNKKSVLMEVVQIY